MMSTELTDDELAQGTYRFEDLVRLGFVTNRTDLNRKQTELKFPKPIKTGKSQASFFKVEVHRWLRWRMELRDAAPELPPPQTKLKALTKPTGTAPVKKARAKVKPSRSFRRAEEANI